MKKLLTWLKSFIWIKSSKKTKVNFNTPLDSDSYLLDNEFLLFDFKKYYENSFGININTLAINTDGGTAFSNPIPMDDNENIVKSDDGTYKIKVKPIDVVNELETVPRPFNLIGLDTKIESLKLKETLIKNHYAKREVSGLLERLENRKKYNKYKTFFDGFQNTTDEKIEKLLSKYDLVMKPSDIFIPEFPDEAINIMKSYSDKVNEICKKTPVYYVIAEEQLFRKAYEKRDPILLVQSPFGFYWQILGAWGKEMILLSEL